MTYSFSLEDRHLLLENLIYSLAEENLLDQCKLNEIIGSIGTYIFSPKEPPQEIKDLYRILWKIQNENLSVEAITKLFPSHPEIQEDPKKIFHLVNEEGKTLLHMLFKYNGESSDEFLNSVKEHSWKLSEKKTQAELDTKIDTLYSKLVKRSLVFILTHKDLVEDLHDENLIIALFKARIEMRNNRGESTEGLLTEYIDKYQINNPRLVKKLITIMAHYAKDFPLYSQNLKIEREEERIEIAKIVAKRDPVSLSQHIENYAITDKNARFEIAAIAAAQNGNSFSYFIRNYELDEQQRIEIAKIVANQQNTLISEGIGNYAINSEEAHIEIALLAARRNGGDTFLWFDNYKIYDKDARLKILKTIALTVLEGLLYNSDPESTIRYIQNRINNRDDALLIYRLCLLNKKLHSVALSSSEEEILTPLENDEAVQRDPLLQKCLASTHALKEQLNRLGEESLEKRQQLISRIEKQETLTLYAYHMLSLLPLHLKERACIPSILAKIIEYRDPLMASHLLEYFCLDILSSFAERYEMKDTRTQGRENPLLYLPMIFLSPLRSKEEDPLFSRMKEILQERRISRQGGKKTTNFGADDLKIQHLLQIGITLLKTNLSKEEILRIISCAISPEDEQPPILEEILKRFSLIQILCDLKKTSSLRESSSSHMTQKLSEAVFEAIREIPLLDLSHISDFDTKFLTTLHAMRVPGAFLSYVSKFSNPELKPIATLMAHSILEGHFKETRYDTSKNPHLRQFKSLTPKFLSVFKKRTLEWL